MNKKIFGKMVIFAVTAVIAVTTCLFATTAIITELEGDVSIVKNGETDWQAASVGAILTTGDKIRSKANSSAELSFKSGHKAKLGGDSYLLIKETGSNTNLELFKGTLFNKVKKLSSTQGYAIITPQAVCAVRGTEFKVNVFENTQIIVYEGSVSAKELVTGTEVIIPAGKYSIVIKNLPPSEPDDIDNLEGASGDGKEEEAKDDEEEEEEEEEADLDDMKDIKAELRREIREAVQDIRIDIETARDVVEDTKENDSATGRTMKDIHGNLVRVEQYLLRPEPNTIQFLNITKRSDYKYKGRMNVSGTGARLDSFEATVKFNREMPEKISDWLNFVQEINDQDLELHPVEVKVILKSNNDSIEATSKWIGTEADGELDDPVVKLISGKEGEWLLDTKDYDTGDNLKLDDLDEGGSVFWVSEDGFETWSVAQNMRIFKDANNNNLYDGPTEETSKLIRIGVESWIIDNDGNLFSLDSLADSGEAVTPFSLLRNIAFETSIVARYNISNPDLNNADVDSEDLTDAQFDQVIRDFNNGTDFFKGNIDLVVTPDIILPVIEAAVQNLDKFDFDSGDDDPSNVR